MDYRALTLPDHGEVKQYAPPITETERAICSVFEAVLHIPEAGRNCSFFELGGDSITGTMALAMLGKRYGIHASIVDLFQNPKPMELARLFEVKKATEPSMIRQNPGTASFILPQKIRQLAEREEAEAVYPADLVSAHFVFLEETGSAFAAGDLHFNLRADLKFLFSETELRGRVSDLMRRHPVLRSYFAKDDEGKRWQIFRKEMEVPVWYRSLEGMGEEARERYFSGFFRVMDEEKAAFQVACFPTGKDTCTVLLRLTHTQVDGMSYVVLLNELVGGVPEGQDAFYSYREKRLNSRFQFPEELRAYYQGLDGSYRLPRTSLRNVGSMDERRISLTAEQTSQLIARCSQWEITLPFYVEYCFGCGLLTVLDRETVWFSHVFSGRDSSFEGSESIVGNLICSLPVRLRRGMSPAQFQKDLMIPWSYPYIIDTEEFKGLNRHNIEFGVVSRIFPSLHDRIAFFTDYPEAFSRGLYLEMTEGKLKVVLRYPKNETEQKTLDMLEDTMTRLILKGL
ncbi:MAG: condensation domain-containing protein [bacterium]